MAAAVGGPPEESEAAAGACVALGSDELRLIFAALLTTRNCEKDVGRCVHARHWRAAAGVVPVLGQTRKLPFLLGHAFWKRPPLTRPRVCPPRAVRCLCVCKEWSEVLVNTPRCASAPQAEGPKRAVSRRRAVSRC